MRIGLILPGFSSSQEDWCIPALLNLVRGLARRADVHVFPLRYPHHRRPYTVYGATVHPQGGAETGGVRRLALVRRAVAAVAKEHRRRSFDILHAVWIDEPGFVAAVAGRFLGVPAVLSLFGGELVRLPDIGYGGQLSRMNRWFVGMALRLASRVTAGSSYLRRLVKPYVGADHLLSIPIGVDAEMFYPGVRDADPALPAAGGAKLLHVASLVPVKDQATLLQAVSQVVERMAGTHLHIVGDGPLRGRLEALAERLGMERNVTFHGAVRYEQMPARYEAADLCVMSSRHEGQELVTLEAAACGRSSVGTAVGVLPDLVPASRVGPVGDARALAEALLTTLRDPGGLAEMGRVSLEEARARYTLERTVRDFLALYAQLSGRSRDGGHD